MKVMIEASARLPLLLFVAMLRLRRTPNKQTQKWRW